MQRACRLCLRAEQHDMTPLFSDDINDDECRLLRLQIADLCSIVVSEFISLVNGLKSSTDIYIYIYSPPCALYLPLIPLLDIAGR